MLVERKSKCISSGRLTVNCRLKLEVSPAVDGLALPPTFLKVTAGGRAHREMAPGSQKCIYAISRNRPGNFQRKRVQPTLRSYGTGPRQSFSLRNSRHKPGEDRRCARPAAEDGIFDP